MYAIKAQIIIIYRIKLDFNTHEIIYFSTILHCVTVYHNPLFYIPFHLYGLAWKAYYTFFLLGVNITVPAHNDGTSVFENTGRMSALPHSTYVSLSVVFYPFFLTFF